MSTPVLLHEVLPTLSFLLPPKTQQYVTSLVRKAHGLRQRRTCAIFRNSSSLFTTSHHRSLTRQMKAPTGVHNRYLHSETSTENVELEKQLDHGNTFQLFPPAWKLEGFESNSRSTKKPKIRREVAAPGSQASGLDERLIRRVKDNRLPDKPPLDLFFSLFEGDKAFTKTGTAKLTDENKTFKKHLVAEPSVYQREVHGSFYSDSVFSDIVTENKSPKSYRKDPRPTWDLSTEYDFITKLSTLATFHDKQQVLYQTLEQLLPPYLRKSPRHALGIHPLLNTTQTFTSAFPTVDVPWPTVFRNNTDILQFEDDLSAYGNSLSKMEEIWGKPRDQRTTMKLLRLLEEGRENGVDLLSNLQEQNREKAVYWIVQVLISPSKEWSRSNINLWEDQNSVDAKSTLNTNVGDELRDTLRFNISEEFERTRIRRGIGIILNSLSLMIKCGWQKEKYESISSASSKRTINAGSANQLQQYIFADPIDPAIIHTPRTTHASKTKREAVKSSDVYRTIVCILGFLHSLEHVPPLVYDSKHAILGDSQEEITQEIHLAAADAFNSQADFILPRGDRPTPVKWNLWLNLITVIASEYGLGVAACEGILANNHIAWINDEVLYRQMKPGSSQQTHSANSDLSLVDVSETIPASISHDAKRYERLFLPVSALQSALHALITTKASDTCTQDNMRRMLTLLERLSQATNGLPYAKVTSRLLSMPEVDPQTAAGSSLLKIKLYDGAWPIEVWYESLIGMIARIDKESIIRTWTKIEQTIWPSDDNRLFLSTSDATNYRITQFADKAEPLIPIDVIAKMLVYFVEHEQQRPHLIRHLIRTLVPIAFLQYPHVYPQLLNPILSFAAHTKEHELAAQIIPPLTPSLTHGTLSSLLNLRLRLDQTKEAQEVFSFMSEMGMRTGDIEMAVVINNAYRENYDMGKGIVERALGSVEEQDRQQAEQNTLVPFSRQVKLRSSRSASTTTGIGEPGWLTALDAAVDNGDREGALKALKGLRIDFEDPRAVAKMGNRIFTILLKGVVARHGSLRGMEMFEAYCVDLAKPYTTNDNRTPTTTKLNKQSSSPLTFDSFITKLEGRVVPNVITLKTIVHQALRERRDYYAAQKREREGRNALGNPSLPKTTAQEHGWKKVLAWGRNVWQLLGQESSGWGELCNSYLIRENMVGRIMRKKMINKLAEKEE